MWCWFWHVFDVGRPTHCICINRKAISTNWELLAIVFGGIRTVHLWKKSQGGDRSQSSGSAPQRLKWMLLRLQCFDLIVHYKKGTCTDVSGWHSEPSFPSCHSYWHCLLSQRVAGTRSANGTAKDVESINMASNPCSLPCHFERNPTGSP